MVGKDLALNLRPDWYSDQYFNRTKEILEKDLSCPIVRMQIFQRNDKACLCGINEVINLLSDVQPPLRVESLLEGTIVEAFETVMLIEGDYSTFAHLETKYLGILARGTRVATNVYRCFMATLVDNMSEMKPILFFPARFDRYENQVADGYAYNVARKVVMGTGGGVSTDAQASTFGEKGVGTIPHGLIAAYGGDTVKATLKFAEYIDPTIDRVALVDFDNDCVKTSLKVAWAMWEKYKETNGNNRYKLRGVRLDTSGNMVDKSIELGTDVKNPCGVNVQLVKKVRRALDEAGFNNIKIIVSGGFSPEKITEFEKAGAPVDAYGVGSSMFNGNFDFTADIVSIKAEEGWRPCAKVGRGYKPMQMHLEGGYFGRKTLVRKD